MATRHRTRHTGKLSTLTNIFSVNTNIFILDTNIFSVDTNIFSVDTNIFSVNTNIFSMLVTNTNCPCPPAEYEDAPGELEGLDPLGPVVQVQVEGADQQLVQVHLTLSVLRFYY